MGQTGRSIRWSGGSSFFLTTKPGIAPRVEIVGREDAVGTYGPLANGCSVILGKDFQEQFVPSTRPAVDLHDSGCRPSSTPTLDQIQDLPPGVEYPAEKLKLLPKGFDAYRYAACALVEIGASKNPFDQQTIQGVFDAACRIGEGYVDPLGIGYSEDAFCQYRPGG